ncbi:hypothetical protein DYB26_006137 [Aphanomyces astaci]|uniref:PX domain-containing protein n=1 Tax=Aphanomyces astaci TaxID=112090 RepID=A0A397EXX3_APHAT|nr:hypothetical protein DYB31_000742 [Aphanomyces astaci]RHZ32079.1 hypothetical protein DYB26_006137 [Aphanomyces astaci]
MKLIIDVPFLADGAVTMVWDIKHTIFLAIIVYMCTHHLVTPLVWAVTMLLGLVGHYLFARSGSRSTDDDNEVGSTKGDAAMLPDTTIVVSGGTSAIVGTTTCHGDNPKRMFYSLSISPAQGLPWTIERSYKEFRTLYHALFRDRSIISRRSSLSFSSRGSMDQSSGNPPSFPKRMAVRCFVNQAKRTQGLATFLQFLVHDDQLSQDPRVVDFLGVHSPLKRVQQPEPALPKVAWTSPRHIAAEEAAMALLTDDERSKIEPLHADVAKLNDALVSRRLVLLRWRKTALPTFDRTLLQNELQTGKMYVADFCDFNLNAVIVVRLHLENSFPQANYMLNAMYTMERALLHASPVHRVTVVIDFSQWQFKHGPEQGIFLTFVKMMEAQYLLHVDRVVLFDLPWYMTQGYNMMKLFFNPITRT